MFKFSENQVSRLFFSFLGFAFMFFTGPIAMAIYELLKQSRIAEGNGLQFPLTACGAITMIGMAFFVTRGFGSGNVLHSFLVICCYLLADSWGINFLFGIRIVRPPR